MVVEGNKLFNSLILMRNVKARLDEKLWMAVLVLQNVVFSSIFSHRVLRHTAVICTSRSLHIRATVCRSNALEDDEGRGDNMLVFVDVENINTVSSFFLMTVLLLSSADI